MATDIMDKTSRLFEMVAEKAFNEEPGEPWKKRSIATIVIEASIQRSHTMQHWAYLPQSGTSVSFENYIRGRSR
jgi:hypothetical protein